MLATIIIIGVIAAIAAPNFLGLLNRNRVNEAAQQIEGALTEAQRQAMRQGRQCSITVDTANGIIANPAAPANGCLLSNRNLNNLIQLNSNLPAAPNNTITFSGKGNITGINPVLVVSIPNGTDLQRCVIIDSLLGSYRSGEYSGTIPTPPVSGSCQ